MSASGITTFVHIGPGDVTAAMARRAVPDARVLTVSSIEDVAAVADELNVQ
jgi:malonyl CoA-acyl carrier protein transacylase